MRKVMSLCLAIVLLFITFAANGRTAEANGMRSADGMRLDETWDSYPIKADANKWSIVQQVYAPPVIDGILNEDFWQQASELGDFRTTYFNKPMTNSPVYRISYDEENLYIGGIVPQDEWETMSSIEIILRTPESPAAYYVASIQVDPASQLAWLNWKAGETGGGQGLQEIKLSQVQSARTINETEGTAAVEAAVPLSGFSLSPGIAPGDEWGINIIHVHNNNTQPMIAWVPLRTSMYDDTELEPGGAVNMQTNVPDQGRLGSLFFEQLPQGELWLPSERALKYTGFTEKELTFKQDIFGPVLQPQYRLSWIDPKGNVEDMLSFTEQNEGDFVTLAFTHPAPLTEGQYQLRVLAYEDEPEDGRLAIFSFDRHSLIDAGNAMFESASPSESPTPVTPSPPSVEIQAILDLIPEQSGFAEVGLPEKPDLKPAYALYRLSADGNQLIASDTGTVYPNSLFPENKLLTVKNRKGEEMEYPYYEDAQGKKYFISARLWYEQRERAIARTNAVASSDPLGAARLLYQFSQAFEGYVPMTNRGQNSYPSSPLSGPPYNMFSGNWNIWNINDLRSIKPLLAAYAKVKQTDAFEVLSQETGVDVEKKIVDEMFIPSIDFVLSMPVFFYNVDPYIWEGLIAAGKTLDRPDYIHLAVEWMNNFMRTSFLADGFWKEVSLSYHNQVAYFIGAVMNELQGYSDPPGYISPRTGKRFDHLDLQNEFGIIDRMDKISKILTYPNGKALPIQDTWADLAGTTLPDAGSVLLPSTGIGRLTLGSGAEQSQLYMMFTPKNGHHHYDPLNLTLYAEGQELMPDLGYTYTNYAQFTLSTIAHNTVVVDGKNMQFNSAAKDGGRIERFVPDADLFRAMRASDPGAYPETSDYSREPWFIPFADGNGGDEGSKGYVLDLFRVSGGERHEYTLQGDANRNALFRTDMPLEAYGPYLLPPNTEVQLPQNYYDFGSAEGQYPGYIYIRDVQQAELQGDQYRVTLTTLNDKGKEQAKLGITGLLESGNNELFLGRSPSIRSTRLYGAGIAYDNNEEAEKYDMPKLVLRRSGTDLQSTFVTALEPYRGEEGPRIETLERLTPDQSPDGAVAVKVTYGGTTDIILSNPEHPEQPLVIGDITLMGEMGMIRLADGAVEKLELVGGTLLKIGNQELTGSGLLTGTVSDTLRKENGQSVDALVTESLIPAAWAGRYVTVTHPDGSTSGFKTGDIRQEQGRTIIELAEQDPGFEINGDGTSKQVYYPAKRWSGQHTFSIAAYEDDAGEVQAFVPAGTVTGTVYGPDDIPLPGAEVRVAGYTSITATTDSAGQFLLPQVPAGTHRILAAMPELSQKASAAVLVTEGEASSVSVSLIDGTAPKWISVVSETTIGDAAAFGAGDPVFATLSEAGDVYMVPAGTIPSLPKLEAAVAISGGTVKGVKATGTAGIPVELDTNGLASGSYALYAVDPYGNISDGFSVVSIPGDMTYIDNTDSSIEYSGVWRTLGNGSEGSDSMYYGDSQAFTKNPGSFATITFYGTSAQVMASKNISRGKAVIYVDDVYQETIDLYSLVPKYKEVVYDTGVLAKGVHKIRIEAAAEINPNAQQAWAWVVFDALKVSREDQSVPVLTGVTGGPLVAGEPVSAISSKQAMLHLVPSSTDQTKTAIEADANSSGASAAVAANANGNISTSGLATGVYKVYAIDASGNLSSGSGNITVINPQETMIDSLNPVVKYWGIWKTVPNGAEGSGSIYYGGSQAHTKELGAYADIPFYGSAAQIIASTNFSRGKAKIYIDGEYKETVDLYEAVPHVQKAVYNTGALSEGLHVVRIEAAGERHPNADPNWPWVVFDALQVQNEVQTPLTAISSSPVNGAVNVPQNQAITVQFSRSLAEGISYGSIALTMDSTSIEADVAIDADVLTISPAGSLEAGGTYTLTIPASAIQDLNGIELEDPYSISFTVMEAFADTSSPAWDEGSELSISDIAQTSLLLHWPAAADNVGVDGYRIYVDEAVTATVYGSTYQYPVIGLAANTTYSFKVKAFDAAGNESAGLSRQASTLAISQNNRSVYVRSGNADLGKLQVLLKGKALGMSPEFNTTTFAYAVETEAENVNIAAQQADSASRLTINGRAAAGGLDVNLIEGKNEFILIVTAENGSSQTYTLNIYRKALKPDKVPSEQLDRTKRTFKDIIGHWAEEAIQKAVEQGMIQGYEDGSFRPDGEVTRAEFIALLVRALALPIEPANVAVIPFGDIASGDWYAQEAAAAYKARMVNGINEWSFAPNMKISREQMAVLLARAYAFLKSTDPFDETSIDFTENYRDGSFISSWALPEVNRVLALGLMQGKEAGMFEPQSSASRAEAVQVIVNLLNKESTAP